jgi:hypothetical protein
MRALLVIGGLIVPLSCGCSGGAGAVGYAKVTGVVTLDSKPVEGATVTFAPKGKGSMSMGLTDAEGKFELKTATGKTGAAVGDHDVLVALSITLGKPAAEAKPEDLAPAFDAQGRPEGTEAGPVTRWIVPEKYSKPGALKATVPSGGLIDHKLDLTSK